MGIAARRFPQNHGARGSSRRIEVKAGQLVFLVAQFVHVLPGEVVENLVGLEGKRRFPRIRDLADRFFIRILSRTRQVELGDQLAVPRCDVLQRDGHRGERLCDDPIARRLDDLGGQGGRLGRELLVGRRGEGAPGSEHGIVSLGVETEEIDPAAQQPIAQFARVDDRPEPRLVGPLGVAGGEQVLRDFLWRANVGRHRGASFLQEIRNLRDHRRGLVLVRRELIGTVRKRSQACQQLPTHLHHAISLILGHVL